MNRTDVTYGQLDRVLRSLGFSCRLVADDPPPARVYEHEKSEASFMIPPSPDSDLVYAHHMAGARAVLANFGIADPKIFDAKFQKAG